MSFSFKINKKAGSSSGIGSTAQVQKSLPTKVSKNAFNDEDDREEEEPDFIDGLDGNQIVSKKNQKKPEKKVLVIPLITKNEWRVDKKKENKDDGEGSTDRKQKEVKDKGDDLGKSDKDKEVEIAEGEKGQGADGNMNEEDLLKQQAIRELLEGAASGNISDKKNSGRSIPILFQNKVPDGYEEDDNMDVSLRPDQATLEDYERIPIEEFGLALLRGMGWKEEEGIGLRNKKVVDMAEPKIRPKGMGLGAEQAHLNKDVTPKNLSSNDNEKEDLTLKIGGFALINRGSKKGYYGQIESFDEDNNRVIIRLAISGKMEAVSKFYIDVVSSKEYKKSSKVINSEKYEEYKNRQDNKEAGRSESHNEEDRRSRSNSRSSDEKEYRSRSRRKYEDDENGGDYESDSKRSRRKYENDENGDDDRGDSRRSRRKYEDDEDDDDDRSDSRRPRHEGRSKSSKKDKKDRHEDRHKSSSSSHKGDDYYKSSSRNGDKHSDHRSRKDKDDKHKDRDRKHRHSSKRDRD